MPSSTVEQYIKTIFMIERRTGAACVPMKVLADTMEVSPGTATSMAKHLATLTFVEYQPRQGVTLSDAGRALALRIVRRHRLIETFLEQILGYDWSEVHTDAEELEHVVSDRFVERIDALLGHPEYDPHGDPIPRLDGSIAAQDVRGLDTLTAGQTAEIARLVDSRSDLLDILKEHDVMPGRRVEVLEHNGATASMRIRAGNDGKPLSLSYDVAASIMVLRP